MNMCEHAVLVDGFDDASVTVLVRFLYVGYMSFVLFLHGDLSYMLCCAAYVNILK